MKLFILAITIGVVFANNWETLQSRCDRNDDKSLDAYEFDCFFLQFDSNGDNYVSEAEFERGWKHEGIEYETRIPFFFVETDITGDFQIGSDDMQYIMKLWDTNGDGRVSENELKEGWNAFYYHRVHESDK